MSFSNKNLGDGQSRDYVGNQEPSVWMNTMKSEEMKRIVSSDMLHASTTHLWMIGSLDQVFRHTIYNHCDVTV